MPREGHAGCGERAGETDLPKGRHRAPVRLHHAVKLVTDALDVERRKAWNELRASGDAEAAKRFKGARWCLLKNPANLDDGQAATLRKLRRRGGDLWRAYTLKEAFREIFSGDLTPDEASQLINRWISRASRCRLPAFVKAAKTIRTRRDGILAALRLGSTTPGQRD